MSKTLDELKNEKEKLNRITWGLFKATVLNIVFVLLSVFAMSIYNLVTNFTQIEIGLRFGTVATCFALLTVIFGLVYIFFENKLGNVKQELTTIAIEITKGEDNDAL